jgi:hypothetical protein
MLRLVCLRVQNTNEDGEPSSHHVVIEVVITRKAKVPAGMPGLAGALLPDRVLAVG